MNKWLQYKLGELSSDISYGYTASADDKPVGPKFLRITDIREGRINWDTVPYCAINEKDYKKNKIEVGDIVIARTGATTGITETIRDSVDAVFASYLIRFRIDKKVANPFYVGYVLKSDLWRDYVSSIVGGSAQPGANAKQFADFQFQAPSISTQTAIAEILSSLDDKIELNNKINQELEALAQAIFKYWFIDFEFPISAAEAAAMGKQELEGKPYKSSGGEMVESELGEIPKGWASYRLDEIAICYDSKRVPLSSMEREKRKGVYPYYGAASQMDSVDDYLFDGVFLLMGEDGSVTDTNGYPVLQYVFGKFWVNNHAHVLQGKVATTEMLLCLLRTTNISHLVTGAVQPKLNQMNMNRIRMNLPAQITDVKRMGQSFSEIFELIRNNIQENSELSKLRDTLLPKLISGDLEVAAS